MVENANSYFWIPVAAPAASHPSTPLTSSPSSPTPATAASSPPSRTLLPATTTSSPPAASVREKGVLLPQSPVHGNLWQNYASTSEDLQRRRSVTLSPLASEKDWEKIQSLSGEFLLKNAMHNAAAGLIQEKEELTSARDQRLVEREQTIARLSELEAKAAKAVALEACLQQSEQEVETPSQEIGPLRVQFDEAKAKWAEVHSVVFVATDRKATSTERLTNLEASLNSKTEELSVAGVKYAQLEEKYKKTIEHNRIFSSTVHELDVSLKSIRSTRENLSADVIQLKKELRHRATSLVFEKTYIMYNMTRKILEEAKAGIIDSDTEITMARELKSAANRGLPAGPDASGSSGSGSETSETEEEPEREDVEGQTDKGQYVEPSVDLPTFPGREHFSSSGFRRCSSLAFPFFYQLLYMCHFSTFIVNKDIFCSSIA
ncbi:uncharacterized protein [Nicotiana tomentosiformis]|uniref:uncharacterized protein n=1 Tax=Nicotiana tomentosiformis TaxID=4098 RepID=UPI00388CDDEA